MRNAQAGRKVGHLGAIAGLTAWRMSCRRRNAGTVLATAVTFLRYLNRVMFG